MKKLYLKALVFTFLIFSGFGFLYSQETIVPQKLFEITSHKTAVEVYANVPDVNVYLNGVYQGKTNLEVFDLTSGFYQLRVEKKGYEVQNHTIFIKPFYGQRFFLEMKKTSENH